MAYETILSELKDGVLTLTLNRPEQLNAYTAQMGIDLADAFVAADEDDAVRVIVVTGAGRHFCAGADMGSGSDSFGGDGDRLFGARKAPGPKGGFVGAIFACRKPSIAAINGGAVGVGVTMTLPMDIRICSDRAKFGFVFARRGLAPEAGSAWFLPRLVGLPQALRWCYRADVFGAEEALRGGLVSEVVAPDDLLGRAQALAREIAEETSPVSIAMVRQLLWRSAGEPDLFKVLAVDGPANMAMGASADVKEGVAAFLEKRKPDFPGKVSADMPPQYPWWE